MYAIGLMSGTSLDGIDSVLCNISGTGKQTNIQVVSFLTYPMDSLLKEEIKRVCRNENVGVDLVCSLNFKLGYIFADAAKAVCAKANMDMKDISFIASHGQTIYHQPQGDASHVPSTLQIGESAIIAYECHCQVLSNFRVMDMAAHGEGAPLVPFSEYCLYSNDTASIALQNIGGIGNVTVLQKQGSLEDVFAFDTGPGNMMIDEAMQCLYGQPYDDKGNIAAMGNVDDTLLEKLMKHPYMQVHPPKSTGREMFGEAFVKQILSDYAHLDKADLIATITKFTATSIADQYRRFILPYTPIDTCILGGGGAHNLTLRAFLQAELPSISITTQDEVGYSSDAKEAIAFVVLGNETLHAHTSNVPSATGAFHPVILGNITPCPFMEEG